MAIRKQVNASDLFVVLEKAFRRRSRECGGCTFTMPYPARGSGAAEDWSVMLTNNCSPVCRGILEEIVARYRREYELAT